MLCRTSCARLTARGSLVRCAHRLRASQASLLPLSTKLGGVVGYSCSQVSPSVVLTTPPSAGVSVNDSNVWAA